MRTVGEMVKHSGSLTPLRKTQYARQCGRMDIANVLHHLGIWDAEVLEGKLGVVAPDGAVYAEDIVLWVGDDTTFSLGAPGKRVRVIVLPAKEE